MNEASLYEIYGEGGADTSPSPVIGCDMRENIGWDLLLGVALVIVAVAVWVLSGQFPPPEQGIAGPALFPRVLAVGLGIGGASVALSALRERRLIRPGTQEPFLEPTVVRVLATLLLVVLAPFAMRTIGLAPTVGLAAFLFSLMMGTGPGLSLGVGGLTTAFAYVIFVRILGVEIQ